ncbi:MAG: division/cell wall cluster transcriptional repressor MraZ [Mariprofundaceae bacterium]|nr:division/cell wall cluster transcriptional repressor MraZ [Mariprofundaceae bacterium]
MFLGGHANAMDTKGRVNVPVAFRGILDSTYNNERVIITRDLLDDCLRAYPMTEWEIWLEKLRGLPSSNRTVRRIHRRVVGSAFEFTPDKQGRVLIPATLRDHAGLSKAIHFAGTNNTFEIWDAEAWRKETALADADSFDVSMLDAMGL